MMKAKYAALPQDRVSYLIGEGFHIPQRDAESLGAAFEALEKRLKSAPTARDIVEAARDSKSPFHPYIFDVDDASAAYSYRLERAQYVIQALRVYLPHYQFVTRALQPDPASKNGFVRTEVAITDRRDVMDQWSNRLVALAVSIDEEFSQVLAMKTAPQSVKDFVAAAREFARKERPTQTRARQAARA